MAVFGGENWREEWKIEQLFQPAMLFDELQVLLDAMSYLKQRGYIVHEFDCRELPTPEALCNDILHKLGNIESDIPFRYMSGTQFWDLLSADVPAESGMVLAFKYFGAFHREHPERAQGMLNAIASEHLWQIKRGRRFWACAHCTSREMKLRPLHALEARWNDQGWDADAIKRFERNLRNNQAKRDALELLAEQYPGLDRVVFKMALWEVAGGVAELFAIELSMDLSVEDILRLLQDYDFAGAIEHEQRIERSSQAIDEAYKLLAERHPILPAPNFSIPSRNIFYPLREVTGAEDMQGILELGLSAEDIVRLLQGYDFEDAAPREAALAQPPGDHRSVQSTGNSSPQARGPQAHLARLQGAARSHRSGEQHRC